VGLYNSNNKKYIANTAQVICSWNAKDENKWSVDPKCALNPVMFRTTEWEDLDKDSVWFIFELVVYVAQNSSTMEYTCGWGHCPIANADR